MNQSAIAERPRSRRRAVPGIIAAFLLGVVLWHVSGSAEPRAVSAGGPAGPLWISDSPIDAARRLLLVVDAAGRHAAVYHVDVPTGTIVLRSTRDISWDLMVGDFNAMDPKPAALRKMLAVPAAEQPR